MPYQFEHINTQNAFTYERIPEINLKDPKLILPDTWLGELATLCGSSSESSANPFHKHIHGTYTYKDDLKTNLSVIYFRLMGKLDSHLYPLSKDEKLSIINKLKEGVENCVPGFHDRVNVIIISFQQPKNLPQLLFKARMGLVEKVSTTLTDEVHANNHCFKIASIDRLGVEAIFKTDPYNGNLSDKVIRQALEKTFYDEYSALNLPFLLTDILRGIFANYGYQGKNENGYEIGTYGRIKDFIQTLQLSKEDMVDYDLLFIIEDEKIIDLNWSYITKLLFSALQKQNVIHAKITPSTLIDCARFSKLYSRNENDLCGFEEDILTREIKEFVNHSSNELFDQLFLVKKEYPNYYLKLVAKIALNPDAIIYLKKLIEKKDNLNLHSLETIILILNSLFLKKDPEATTILKMLLTQENNNGRTALMLSISQPESCKMLLEFITQHQEALGGVEFMRKILTQENNNGRTALMLSVSQPESCKMLLAFINQHQEALGVEFMRKILMQKIYHDYETLLMIAANKVNPESCKMLLEFITQHLEALGVEFLRTILTQKDNDGWTALMLASPESFKILLAFINQHQEALDAECIRMILMQKNKKRMTVLTTELRYPSETFKMLLEFITQHKEALGVEFMREILMQKDNEGSTALMLAGSQPESCKMLLAFINQHQEALGVEFLSRIFMQIDNHGRTALMLASPESFKILLAFINQHQEALGMEILRMISRTDYHGGTILMLIGDDQRESCFAFFDFVIQHLDILHTEMIYMFKKSNSSDYNCHLDIFFEQVCEKLTQPISEEIAKNLVTLASCTIGRDKLHEIVIAQAEKLKSSASSAEAIQYLQNLLAPNTSFGVFFGTHRGIQFFQSGLTKSEIAINQEIELLRKTA